MVDHSFDQVDTVALIEQTFNFIPGSIESELSRQGCEFNIGVEVLALLEDSDRHCLLDVLLIFG